MTNSTSPTVLNFNARAPHVAIAAQVEQQGSFTAKALYAAASDFNAKFFAGALLPCFVEVTTPGSLRALADYRARSHEGVESHIRVSQKAAAKGLRFALDVLLHEMIHAYQQEIAGDLELGHAGHGPKWTAECNRIGKLLGLPEVFTKGRGGPNSAQWPLCVRPAGYYGEEKAEPQPEGEPTRKPRKAKTVAAPESLEAQLVRLLCQCDVPTLQTIQAFCAVRIEAASAAKAA